MMVEACIRSTGCTELTDDFVCVGFGVLHSRYSSFCFHCRTTPVHVVNLASLRNCLTREGTEDYCVSCQFDVFKADAFENQFFCFLCLLSTENESASTSSTSDQNRPAFEVSVTCSISCRRENILHPAALGFDIVFAFSTRTWITNIYSHSPLGTVRSPSGFLTKTSTFERGYLQRTTGRQKTGEKGKWHHGSDTVRGNRGVDMFLDDRVRAMKECPH